MFFEEADEIETNCERMDKTKKKYLKQDKVGYKNIKPRFAPEPRLAIADPKNFPPSGSVVWNFAIEPPIQANYILRHQDLL